jgi:tRNA modification GTPase
LEELGSYPECRLSEPGEFTRRALENGCLDLVQVEALSDLIDAETEAQRRHAMKVFDGAFGALVDQWRTKLIRASALLQVSIDFSDEEIPDNVFPEVTTLVREVEAEIADQLGGYAVSERLHEGFEVAILGKPNVGKSTLLNFLAGREAAITSSQAGTTRDVIEVRLDLNGIPITVLDTAGLREAEDEVERIGIDRARARAERADLRLVLRAQEDGEVPPEARPEDIFLVAKQDKSPCPGGISGKTGEGVPALIEQITGFFEGKLKSATLISKERHKTAMQLSLVSLRACLEEIERDRELIDIAAEELRSAVHGLESVVGRVGVEDVLDEIFSSFCLGK